MFEVKRVTNIVHQETQNQYIRSPIRYPLWWFNICLKQIILNGYFFDYQRIIINCFFLVRSFKIEFKNVSLSSLGV